MKIVALKKKLQHFLLHYISISSSSSATDSIGGGVSVFGASPAGAWLELLMGLSFGPRGAVTPGTNGSWAGGVWNKNFIPLRNVEIWISYPDEVGNRGVKRNLHDWQENHELWEGTNGHTQFSIHQVLFQTWYHLRQIVKTVSLIIRNSRTFAEVRDWTVLDWTATSHCP